MSTKHGYYQDHVDLSPDECYLVLYSKEVEGRRLWVWNDYRFTLEVALQKREQLLKGKGNYEVRIVKQTSTYEEVLFGKEVTHDGQGTV